MEAQATSFAAADSQSGTPSTVRLVIRVKLPSEGSPPASVPQRSSRTPLLLISGALAVLLLSWIAVSMFRTEPTPAPSKAAPAVSHEPLAKAVTAATETKSALAGPASTEAKPVESEVRQRRAAPPVPVNEVIPNVARSAQDSIRGTIIVTIRVIVGKEGTVLTATADDPGPSRYFERLSIEAAKKWTFTPAASTEQRVTLVRFYFTRNGTTGRASPPP